MQLNSQVGCCIFISRTPFNDAYRYVDWLLTVPLLLIELILVMKLPEEETVSLGWKLGVASAMMVALGYPGEIQDDLSVRWFWWSLAKIRDSEVKAATEGSDMEETYELPEVNIITVGSKPFHCPEVLSQPNFMARMHWHRPERQLHW